MIIFVLGSKGSKNSNNESGKSSTAVGSNVPAATQKEIVVGSQIVKKVEGKYRYFFDIRNNDSTNFEGEVTISIYNGKQESSLGDETFTTQGPIEPGIGKSVYFDINTGPTSQVGEYGIARYTYSVKEGEKVVKTGEGSITQDYEDLDSI